MSAELIKARKQLSGINSLLKQGKYMPAAHAVQTALLVILKNPLMKAEKDEFGKLIEQAVYSLNRDTGLRQLYPLVLSYTIGAEKKLYQDIKELLSSLQQHVNEEVQSDIKERQVRKTADLEKGQEHLDNNEAGKARAVFEDLMKSFKNDTQLKADIADRYVKAKMLDDALKLLEDALKHDPQAVYLYNRIGIVLRQLGQFDAAEKYFLKALDYTKNDEYLYFNLGRLYYDWKQWEKMKQAAEQALRVNPDFTEAAKMRSFAAKKLG